MTVETQSETGPDPVSRDAELIARVLAGERELFHELIRPYEKSVYLAVSPFCKISRMRRMPRRKRC